MENDLIKIKFNKVLNNYTSASNSNNSEINSRNNPSNIFKFGELTLNNRGINNRNRISELQPKTNISFLSNNTLNERIQNTEIIDGKTGIEIEDKLSAEFLDAEDDYYNALEKDTKNTSNSSIISKFMSKLGFDLKSTQSELDYSVSDSSYNNPKSINNSVIGLTSTINDLLIQNGGGNMQPQVLNSLSNALVQHLSSNNISQNNIGELVLNGFKPYLDEQRIPYNMDDLNFASITLFNLSTAYSSSDGIGGELSITDLTNAMNVKSFENVNKSKDIVSYILKSNGASEMSTGTLNAFSDALITHLATNTINPNEINNLIDNGLKPYFDQQGIQYTEKDLLAAKSSLLNLVMKNGNNGVLSIFDLDSAVRTKAPAELKKSQDVLNTRLAQQGGTNMRPLVLNALSSALISHISTNNIAKEQIPNLILNGFKPYLDQQGIPYTENDLNAATTTLYQYAQTYSTDDSLSLADVVKSMESSNINSSIDDYVRQSQTGDCWLIAGVVSLNTTLAGQNAIKNSIIANPDGSVTVDFKGLGVNYNISANEINLNNHDLISGQYSRGDNDMLVLELATEKLFADIASGKVQTNKSSLQHNAQNGIKGGKPGDIIYCLTGVDSKRIKNNDDSNLDINQINNALGNNIPFGNNIAASFSLKSGEHNATLIDGTPYNLNLGGNHALSILNVSNNMITFVDPVNTAKPYTMTIDEFSKLGISEIQISNL